MDKKDFRHSKSDRAKITNAFGKSGQLDWTPEDTVVPDEGDAVPEAFSNASERDGKIEIGEGSVWKRGVRYE